MIPSRQLTKLQKRNINILLFIIPFLMGCGVDLYLPSLPTLVQQFKVPIYLVQMTISVYMLGYGVGQAILGILSDVFGRKKIMFFSGFLYTFVSLLAACHTPNIFFLDGYRLCQGIGIAGLAATSRAIAADCYSGLDLYKAMTFISTSFGLGPIIGPLIGAYLQHYFDWQADFYFFSIYGCFILFYITFKLPETINQLHDLNLNKMIKNTFHIGFNPCFLIHSLWGSLTYSILVMFAIIGPFLIQETLNFSIVQYGQVMFFLGFAYFIGTLANRSFINYFSPMKNTLIALINILLLSCGMYILQIFIPLNIVTLITPLWLIFFFCGIAFPNSVTKSIGLFPKSAGTGSALFGTCLGITIFLITILTTLFNINSQGRLSAMLIYMDIICLLLFIIAIYLEKYAAISIEEKYFLYKSTS